MDSIFTLDEIDKAAEDLLANLHGASVVAIHGQMGAGKTTLISAICKKLKCTGPASSPTFSIINEYIDGNGKPVYHMDLYRLGSEDEAIRAGVEECFYSGSLCLVEWPENAPGIFPDNTLHCYLIYMDDNKRKLKINL